MGKWANARRIYGFIISRDELIEKLDEIEISRREEDIWVDLETFLTDFKEQFSFEDQFSFIEIGDVEEETYFVIGLERSKLDTEDQYYVEQSLEEEMKTVGYLQKEETKNILDKLSKNFYKESPKMAMYYGSCIYP